MHTRKTILVVSVLSTALLATGFFTTYPKRMLRRVERQWLILNGGLIDVGGYHLRIDCWGSGKTVVFESGLSQPRSTWGVVPGEVSKFARVCTYDRAGVGESDKAGFTRTSADAVNELRTLLERVGEKGPYVIVGHSFGGMNARLFAAEYPREVDAMVLIEPTHEDEYQVLNHLRPEDVQISDQYLMRGDNPEGLDLLASQTLVRSITHSPAAKTTVLSATLNTAEVTEEERELHRELQVAIVNATKATHEIVGDSGHFIQLDKPQVVVDAIRAALSEAR